MENLNIFGFQNNIITRDIKTINIEEHMKFLIVELPDDPPKAGAGIIGIFFIVCMIVGLFQYCTTDTNVNQKQNKENIIIEHGE